MGVLGPDNIADHANLWKIIRTRTLPIQQLAKRFMAIKDEVLTLTAPEGLYPPTIVGFESIEYEAMLQMCANGWLDITIINWCCW